ncbi:hypothetical protein halTADL_1935 [Halohasta litchfieldiae]|jgi:hypothetical protein|uniref:Uncharacterized protein n=1 Tax=Halohasta litchfieldiae TaxID=1073996 RepID=A0A1H6QTK9_9EURY|nr:hypothetical protein [Halohasta litchfieldiae]ATW88687.1 hypothetical protein halTADL_1935 [Halohasta litchfieldiae]SEI46949.1 hypothetical protein SAMN05444271_10129 [Halohasta litchfieldiae]
MKRLPLVIAILLITTVIGAGVGPLLGDTDSVGQADPVDFEPSYATQVTETTEADRGVINVLAIPTGDIERSELRRQYADLGPASEFDTGVTTDRLATRAIERQLESTSADAERESQLDAELSTVEAEVDGLETRERTATRAFSRGEIAPREFLIELATIHLKATVLRDRTAMLESRASTFDDERFSNSRFQRIEYDLQMLEGPLRAHAVAVLRAERPANRIMIETSDSGIALTAIDDGQYIREVTRKELRKNGTGELTPERAEELTQQQYPTLWNRSTSWSSAGPGSLFVMSVNFEQGGFQTFIDGPSERTFIEHQQLPLDTVITGSETTKIQDGLNVTVEQTYAGGPFRLTVTDESTGEPVEATVTVGQDGQESQTVGTTDAEGALWALSPRGTFTITIFGEGNSAAFIDITPPAPETVTTAE